ncbi:MAG TPA: hypothetical protein VIK62_06425 [Verrucomicrobiae bacterium]
MFVEIATVRGMKKLSSKEVNESWNQASRQMRYRHNGIKPHPHLSKLPTAQQLATLAATLARQSNNNSDKLCSEAMNLWATAHEYMALQRLCDKDWQIEKARMDANRIEPAEPKRYPITRDDFCRLVLPKLNGRTGERASIIKTWLSHDLAMSRWMVTDQKSPISDFTPTKSEVDDAFAEMQRKPMDYPAYRLRAYSFLEWYQKWRTKETSRKRVIAAQVRHKK